MEYPGMHARVFEQVKDVIAAKLLMGPNCLKFNKGFSSSPVGLPGSKPGLIDRFHIDVHYGGSVVTVLALVGESTSDLIILEDKSSLLPDELLNNAGPPDGESLLYQLTWMIQMMGNHQKKLAYQNEKVKPILDILNNSIENQYFSTYEVKTEGSQVTFRIKRELPPVTFPGMTPLFELTEENGLKKCGENYFILKLGFDEDTGKPNPSKTKIYFSKKVKLIICDYDIPIMSRPQTWRPQDCENYLIGVTDNIERAMEHGLVAWGQRANFFKSIYRLRQDAFVNGDPKDEINVNGEKMNVLTVSIYSDFHVASLKILLDENFPATYPEYILTITIEDVHSKVFQLKPRSIHKKEPFGEAWSIEGMALEVAKILPTMVEVCLGKAIEEVSAN